MLRIIVCWIVIINIKFDQISWIFNFVSFLLIVYWCCWNLSFFWNVGLLPHQFIYLVSHLIWPDFVYCIFIIRSVRHTIYCYNPAKVPSSALLVQPSPLPTPSSSPISTPTSCPTFPPRPFSFLVQLSPFCWVCVCYLPSVQVSSLMTCSACIFSMVYILLTPEFELFWVSTCRGFRCETHIALSVENCGFAANVIVTHFNIIFAGPRSHE